MGQISITNRQHTIVSCSTKERMHKLELVQMAMAVLFSMKGNGPKKITRDIITKSYKSSRNVCELEQDLSMKMQDIQINLETRKAFELSRYTFHLVF